MTEKYVVRAVGPALGEVATSLIPLVLFAFLWSRFGGRQETFLVFGGLALVIMGLRVRRSLIRLKVDEQGVALSYPNPGGTRWAPQVRTAEWRWVHRVQLDATRSTVGVVLRHDAPMPSWATARITDPHDPEGGVHYERRVPGLDVQACAAAVRALAPTVEVRYLG